MFDLSDVGQVLEKAVRQRDLSVDDLIALAPVITSSGEECRSIEIRGTVCLNDRGRLLFRALYRAPDRYSLLIRDETDGPPLLFAADRHLFIYDPVRPIILYSRAARFTFHIHAVPAQLRLDWNCWWNSSTPSRIDFDVPSLFRSFGKKGDVVKNEAMKTGEGQYRIAKTTQDGGRVHFHVNLIQACAFTGFELFNERDGSVSLSVDRIIVNAPLKDEEFSFPTQERLAEQMNVQDCTEYGLLKSRVDMKMMIWAHYARFAVHNPKLRESIKIPGLADIDWEQVKENDNKYAPLLREALSKK